jgi:hypothetical protein
VQIWEVNLSNKEWDVFISHASEDKDLIARPLAVKLTSLGIKVWFDEFELRVGDSLSGKIDFGLSKSSFGVVVLSRDFFSKAWPEYEYRGLIAKSVGNNRTILPVWHNIDRSTVLDFSPTLADIMAENTNKPIDKLALNIINAINPDLFNAISRKIAYKKSESESKIENIDPKLLNLSSIRHERLPLELLRRISIIRGALTDIYPMSMEQWVDGFRRDAHPSREVRAWEFIASRYLQIRDAVTLSDTEKGHIFSSLLATSMGSQQSIVDSLSKLDSDRAQEITKALNAENETLFRNKSERELDFPNADYETFSGAESSIDDIYIQELVKVISREKND